MARRPPYRWIVHSAGSAIGGYTPLVNSLEVAALTAVAGTILVFAGAYLVEKCRTVASGPLYMLSILPLSIPGMVLGLAYIFTFNAPGSPLNRKSIAGSPCTSRSSSFTAQLSHAGSSHTGASIPGARMASRATC